MDKDGATKAIAEMIIAFGNVNVQETNGKKSKANTAKWHYWIKEHKN